MSDFNSSLPVRTENNGDVRVFIADSTTPSQLNSVDTFGSLSSLIKDATGTSVTAQANGTQYALDVGINVAGVQIDPRQVRALTAADVVTSNQGAAGLAANGWFVRLTDGTDTVAVNVDGSINITDNGGSITVDGTVTSSNFPTTVDTNYGVVGANTLRTASQIGNATGAADFNFGSAGAQTLRVASLIGNATGAASFNAGATGAQTLRVEANQGAPGLAANAWFTKITDGTDTVLVTATGELNVLSTAQPGVDIGDVTVNNGAGASAVNIQDGGNSITVDGTVAVSNFPTTVDTNYGTVGANTLRSAAQIGNATGAADFNAGATGAQTLRVEANQGEANAVADAWPVKLTDGVDTVAVNTDGSINVVIADSTPGTPINDYNIAAAVASGATSNHDYAVTAGKTFYFNQFEASSSGKMKIEVQIETGVATGIFNTKWVKFNSTADTGITVHIDNPIAVAAGVRVRMIRTNKENPSNSQDLYSTISGYELP